MNNSSGGTLISIPSVLCGDDGLSRHIAASYGPGTAEVKECGHLESCLTEYPIITAESVTSVLFRFICVINNNTDPLCWGESGEKDIIQEENEPRESDFSPPLLRLTPTREKTTLRSLFYWGLSPFV